jgi:hypothetical protein
MRSEIFLDQPATIQRHLDRIVGPLDRRSWSAWFILCDVDNRVLVHYPVTDVPAEPAAEDCAHTVGVFADVFSALKFDAGMLVVVTRPGTAGIRASDRQWFRAAHEVCARSGVRLVGVHLMTPDAQREIVLDDAI